MYLDLTFETAEFGDHASIAICFVNKFEQEVCTGFDKGRKENIFLDRRRGGSSSFNPTFSRRSAATRAISKSIIRFQIYLDVSAIEVFVDSGLTCLTSLFYPDEPFTSIQIRHHSGRNPGSKLVLSSVLVQGLKFITSEF